MSPELILVLSLGVLIVAFLYSSVGHAGASGYIAVMALAGVSPLVIKPTALVLNIAVSVIASWQFWRDTVGMLTPIRTFSLVTSLRQAAPNLVLEFHGHNDFGMATADTIAAFEAGAQAASVTVNGLGERVGNAALEEVVMALRKLLGLDPGIHTPSLSSLSALVAQASGRVLPDWKPVTGPACFRHESGIHTAGLVKDRSTYEPFPAEEVGRSSPGFVIGRHSGTHGLRQLLEREHLNVPHKDLPLLLEQVRSLSLRKKSALRLEDLAVIVGNMRW